MDKKLWIAFGLTFQIIFGLRFAVQWLASEKEKKSVIPISFWYLSLLGGFGLLAYAIHRRDPVFILGQSFGCFVYLRNLFFLKKNKA
jgi:lipid-A-disaccharide synthase-like uncharacterized protein